LTNFYDAYRLFYSEMLRRCGLLIKAVEITHLMSTNTTGLGRSNPYDGRSFGDEDGEDPDKVGIVYACRACSNSQSIDPVTPPVTTAGLYCDQCRAPIGPRCVWCGLLVKGHAIICLSCGHGGHLLHMQEWFENESDDCAAPSCGCECLKLNTFE